MRSEPPRKPRGPVAKSTAASRIISTAKSFARVAGSSSSASSKSSFGDRSGSNSNSSNRLQDPAMSEASASQSRGQKGRSGIGRFRLEDIPRSSPGSVEVSESSAAEEGLECPVCWESFNDQDNTPYVLWCGHTLCRNCVNGLRWAAIKLPGLSLQLPLFIQCPWCQFLTARLTWKGCLKLPSKNYFLLWLVESVKAGNIKQRPDSPTDTIFPNLAYVPSGRGLESAARHYHHSHQESVRPMRNHQPAMASASFAERLDWGLWRLWGGRLMALSVHLIAKLPLVLLLLFIVFYVLPFSSLVLALYCVITVVFAVPCFLIVYFSYPSLDWLVREILT